MSGAQIGTAVGFIAGFFLPGGPQVWAGIGGILGGWISPTQIEGPRLTDGMDVTAQEGVPNPWGFGTFSCGCNVINAFDLREVRDTDDGKGSGQEQVTYSYVRSFALGICRAVRNTDGTYSDIAGILRVTHNGKDVYNILPDATAEQTANNAEFLSKCKFYLGGETQEPDPTLESFLGAGNVSAYRGQVYMVATDYDQTDARGAMGAWEFVVAMGGTATVSKAIVLGRMTAGVTRDVVYNSPDGLQWNSALDPNTIVGFPQTYITPLGSDAYVVWGVSDSFVTRDDGVTWDGPFGSFGGAGGQRQSHCAGEVLVIPENSGDDISITSDGENYTSVNTGLTGSGLGIGNAASNQDLLMVCYINQSAGGDFYCGTAPASNPLAWSVLGEIPIYPSGDHWMSCNQETFAVGGQSSNISPLPVIAYTHNNGVSWTAVTLSTSSGENVGYLHPGGEGRWVALIDNGEIWYSDDDCETWAQSADTLPQLPSGITWNGDLFIAGFGPVGGGGIWTSPTGESWSASTEPLTRVYLISSRPPVTQSITPDSIALGDIVSEVCRRDGLVASDIDVTDLTQEVKGFKVAVETTGEAIIASLMPGYFFDAAEWDDKVRFVNRGGAPVFDLVVDDLVQRDGPVIEETEVQEIELLRKVIVHTMDPDAGYVETPQSWERRASTVAAKGEQTLQLPVVMTADEARQVANKRIKVAWSEPRRFGFELPYTIPQYTPTDCGTLTDKAGRIQRIRLERMTEDGGIIDVREARLDRQSAYTSNVTGVQSGRRPTTAPQPPGPTFFWAGNLPSLRTSDNVPGMYISAAGYQRGWHGAAIWLSTDNGASFQRIMEWPLAARMGSLTADIDANDEPIEVFMNFGTLSTVTDDQLADRHNAFAITTNGVSEVGQFKTATLTGTQAYDLTDTIRGALTTTAASHVIGDPFVMLASAVFLPLDISLAGRTLIFKAVSYGSTLDDTDEYPVVFNPLFTSVVVEAYENESGDIYVDQNGSTYYRIS